MNLMFRKNFRPERGSGGGGGGGGGAGGGRNTRGARRQREAAAPRNYSPMDDHHYRTHIFFGAAPRSSCTLGEGLNPTTPNVVNCHLCCAVSLN